jgi:hypothetical protein
MPAIQPYGTHVRREVPAGHGTVGDRRRYSLIAGGWMLIALLGVVVIVFARDILPFRFGSDGIPLRAYMESSDLWEGMSYDSYVNTARVWWLVSHVVSAQYLMPAYYCVLVMLAIRFLGVFDVPLVRYQLLAAAWLLCSAIFLWGLSKEMIAVPVALFFCLARGTGPRLLATLIFLFYAAFFRQYWAICFFYFVAVQMVLRMQIAKRPRLAALIFLVAFILPFVVAAAVDFGPLTEIRMTSNVDRFDSPDARTAFGNPVPNTGLASDIANAVIVWAYMNIPVTLLGGSVSYYFIFIVFQIWSLWFFAAGCASFLRDARKIKRLPDSTHLRCAAFVIAYSLTQALFEPDFGSFLRHEIVIALPMMIVAFYRAHAMRHRSTGSAGAPGGPTKASRRRGLTLLPSLGGYLRPLR